MKSSNIEFDSMSIETLPSYTNTLNYTNRKYSKDDIDIEAGFIESEVSNLFQYNLGSYMFKMS